MLLQSTQPSRYPNKKLCLPEPPSFECSSKCIKPPIVQEVDLQDFALIHFLKNISLVSNKIQKIFVEVKLSPDVFDTCTCSNTVEMIDISMVRYDLPIEGSPLDFYLAGFIWQVTVYTWLRLPWHVNVCQLMKANDNLAGDSSANDSCTINDSLTSDSSANDSLANDSLASDSLASDSLRSNSFGNQQR